MSELWKEYPKIPDYQISSKGRVRKVKKDGSYFMVKPQLVNKTHLIFYTKHSNVALGRAVWETFVGEIPNGYFVQFKDSCSKNCCLENLYIKHSKEVFSERAKNNKNFRNKGKHKVIDLKTGKIYRSIAEASRCLYVSYFTIYYHCNHVMKNKAMDISVAWFEEE